MSKLFLYVDSNGFQTESDSYEKTDFKNVGGVGSEDAPVLLDAAGLLNISMIPVADIDHGSLTGLGDDDHPQYALLTDLASSANGEGASLVAIEDAGGYTLETTVEGAIAELYEKIAYNGVEYTVGVGGIAKGELAFISGNDEIKKYSNLSLAYRGIGLALTTQIATEQVVILANDTVLAGVLTSATAGTVYYWTGSALSATMPTGGGSHVYKVGVAKNATDLHVEVEFIKKNA